MNESWVTAFWESEGTVTLFPHRNKMSPTGFYWHCSISIFQAEKGKDGLDATCDYLDKHGIYSIIDLSSKGTDKWQKRYRLSIRRIEDCIKFLNLIEPYIVMNKRRQQAKLGMKALLLMSDKEHLIQRGFIELIDIMTEMQQWKSASSSSKYTREYFERLWKKQGGFYNRKRTRGRITKRQWPIIIKMREEGATLKEIGDVFGVALQSIWYLLEEKKIGKEL